MTSRTMISDGRRELAHRVSGGIEITLYWSVGDNGTCIEVWQPSTEELLTFPVARERALEAFYHPFAQLATAFDAVAAVGT
jgi:hypothetical protein